MTVKCEFVASLAPHSTKMYFKAWYAVLKHPVWNKPVLYLIVEGPSDLAPWGSAWVVEVNKLHEKLRCWLHEEASHVNWGTFAAKGGVAKAFAVYNNPKELFRPCRLRPIEGKDKPLIRLQLQSVLSDCFNDCSYIHYGREDDIKVSHGFFDYLVNNQASFYKVPDVATTIEEIKEQQVIKASGILTSTPEIKDPGITLTQLDEVLATLTTKLSTAFAVPIPILAHVGSCSPQPEPSIDLTFSPPLMPSEGMLSASVALYGAHMLKWQAVLSHAKENHACFDLFADRLAAFAEAGAIVKKGPGGKGYVAKETPGTDICLTPMRLSALLTYLDYALLYDFKFKTGWLNNGGHCFNGEQIKLHSWLFYTDQNKDINSAPDYDATVW